MIRLLVPALCSAVLLAGCGGDKQSVDFSQRQAEALFYSYPADQQQHVSVHAPVVLQLSQPQDIEQLSLVLEGPHGPVATTLSSADQGRTLIVQPQQPLAHNSDYQLHSEPLALNGLSDNQLSFRTAPAVSGPANSQKSSAEFTLANLSPGGEGQPLMDFSTLRLRFSHPLDTDQLRYGEQISLLGPDDQLVPATLLASHHQVSIDPQDDLQPGQPYRLVISDSLQNRFGASLAAPIEHTLTPADSQPRETLVLEAMATDPLRGCNEEGVTISPLSGKPINCVPLIAKLLGDSTVSKLSGDVFAELAFVPNFPEAVPLRVAKGSLLEGEPLEVMIGGQVPAGFDSGAVSVHFLSDASGFLQSSPYSNEPTAPRRIQLSLDLAFSTADSRANGAFTQTLLHVELIGRAMVEDGRMVIDALGMIEPEVLGIETAYGLLSFHMESYLDQENPPQPPVDLQNPQLQAWQPGDYADRHRPGDPLVLNFNKSLDQNSLHAGDSLQLSENGAAIEFDWSLDGAALVIKPHNDWRFGHDYQLQISDAVTDLSGNPALPETISFSMVDYHSGNRRSPYAATVYPGFPCAIHGPSRNLADNIQGRCLSAFQGQAGDLLPVPTLPGNRPIQVQFSQNMDLDSISLGEQCGQGSFQVEQVDEAGNCLAAVPGKLRLDARRLTFFPDDPWQADHLYRYTLASHTASGCNGEVICSEYGDPLQTAQLQGPAANQGGPDMTLYFRAQAASDNVLLALRNLPKADINANFQIDGDEPKAVESPPGSGQYPTPTNAAKLQVNNTGGLVTNANLGCPIGDSCPADKFTYLNGGINADIVGWNEAEQAVEVILYPPALITTNTDVYVRILALVNAHVPTEPLVMRGRYQLDDNGQRTVPPRGWIRETEIGLTFETELDLFLDAPQMEAPLGLPHNLHSLPLNNVKLSGPVEFLADGRLVIGLLSSDAVPIGVSIGGGAATIDLGIPLQGINLTFQSGAIKD